MSGHFTVVARLVCTLKTSTVYCRRSPSCAIDSDFAAISSSAATGHSRTDLRALSAQLGLETQVRFLGFVQTEEVAKGAGINRWRYCRSATRRPCGQAVVEAQAMGCPVIISENCGARDELVKSGVNGYLWSKLTMLKAWPISWLSFVKTRRHGALFAKATLQNEALIDVCRICKQCIGTCGRPTPRGSHEHSHCHSF